MPRTNRLLVVALLLFPIPFQRQLKAQRQTSVGQGAGQEGCPDDRAWTGRYTNHDYGFAITIPDHLQGFWNSTPCANGPGGCACMSDHGRIIPLTTEPYEPKRHLEVYAGHAAFLDEPTLALLVEDHLAAIRQRGDPVEVRKRSRVSIAGVRAERAVARYYDGRLKRWSIEDFIEALRDGTEYSLSLVTQEKSYKQDRAVFEAVARSFSLTRD